MTIGSGRQKVRLNFAVWDNTGRNGCFNGYGVPDDSPETKAAEVRLVLFRVPELAGLADEAWDYEISIRR